MSLRNLEIERERAYDALLSADINPIRILRLDEVGGALWLTVDSCKVFRTWPTKKVDHGVATWLANVEWSPAEMFRAGMAEFEVKATMIAWDRACLGDTHDWRALVDAAPRMHWIGDRLYVEAPPQEPISKSDAEVMGLALLAYARAK